METCYSRKFNPPKVSGYTVLGQLDLVRVKETLVSHNWSRSPDFGLYRILGIFPSRVHKGGEYLTLRTAQETPCTK